jgi:hypothetical protein
MDGWVDVKAFYGVLAAIRNVLERRFDLVNVELLINKTGIDRIQDCSKTWTLTLGLLL